MCGYGSTLEYHAFRRAYGPARQKATSESIFYRLRVWGEERATPGHMGGRGRSGDMRATDWRRPRSSAKTSRQPLIRVEADARVEWLASSKCGKQAANGRETPIAKNAQAEFAKFSNNLAVQSTQLVARKSSAPPHADRRRCRERPAKRAELSGPPCRDPRAAGAVSRGPRSLRQDAISGILSQAQSPSERSKKQFARKPLRTSRQYRSGGGRSSGRRAKEATRVYANCCIGGSQCALVRCW